MHCPNCSYPCNNHDSYCCNCGATLEKKGRHWVPILLMVLIFAFGTTLFLFLPSSAPPSVRQTPWFYIENGVLFFDADSYDGGSELQIPESVSGMEVTALAEGCFENCTSLTAIMLPSSLQAIGEDAFRNCTALRGIEIPESVIFIGQNAFSGCSTLEAVCVYDGIQSIGTGTFSGCSKLQYIYYSGDFQEWNELYGEFINPYTKVYSQDGTFYQGEMTKD